MCVSPDLCNVHSFYFVVTFESLWSILICPNRIMKNFFKQILKESLTVMGNNSTNINKMINQPTLTSDYWIQKWPGRFESMNKFDWFMVLNVTFNNISLISWLSVLFVEETGIPGENHTPVANHWQTLSVTNKFGFQCFHLQ